MTLRFDFTGRSVVVTGGAAGIGAAVAEFFADAGADVTVADVVEPAAAKAARFVRCDVSEEDQVTDLFSQTVAAAGGIDVLVNNAGVLRDRVLWKMQVADWDTVLAVHLRGTFLCMRAAVPHMRAAGHGRIVNVSSYTGLHGNIGQSAYAAAKAGIVGLTKTAAKELASFGIRVNAVVPNAETAMVASIPHEKYEQLRRLIPLGRFGRPEEMAAAIGFLSADEADYITGAVLAVDGGLSM
jgi:3-oxoacyl-[acyl-carrier protein] reductase